MLKDLFMTSSMVRGLKEDVAEEDNHPTNPKEIYGTMKLAGGVQEDWEHFMILITVLFIHLSLWTN